MHEFPEGFYAAFGLRLAALGGGLGSDVRPIAGTPVELGVDFPNARWADGPRGARAPGAILVDWNDAPNP